MYHYLYGSMEGSGGLDTSIESDAATDDMDALLGEGLTVSERGRASNSSKHAHGRESDHLRRTDGSSSGFSLSSRTSSIRSQREHGGSCSTATCFVCTVMTFACIASVVLLVFVAPSRPLSTLNSTTAQGYATTSRKSSSASSAFHMSFPSVVRSDYGEDVDAFLKTSLFHSSLLNQGESSNTFTFPFPTGAFWINFVLHATADQGLSYPIFAYPYGFKWSDSLFQVSYPYSHRKLEATAIHDYFFPDLTFGCDETVSTRHITEFDSLSVTLQYETENKGLWSLFLVQGSPYVSMEFGSVTPYIRALSTFTSFACLPSANGNSTSATTNTQVCKTSSNSTDRITTLEGNQFVATSQQGWQWIIFTSDSITLAFDTRVRTTIRATAPFNGALRVAIVPPPKSASGESLNVSSTGLQRLIAHCNVYPVHGEVSWQTNYSETDSSFQTSTMKSIVAARKGRSSTSSAGSGRRVATVRFRFETKRFTSSKDGDSGPPLLMLALPHHALRLDRSMQLSPQDFDLEYYSIKGWMTPVLGNAWAYDQLLISPGFDDDSGSNNQSLFLEPTVRSALEKSMKEDINLALPTKTENIYGFGKQAARLAQLAHISHRLTANATTGTGSNSSSTMELLLSQATTRLSSALEAILSGGVSDELVYDTNLGGLVTVDGLRDSSADFGNGRYNDHHFHYGYLVSDSKRSIENNQNDRYLHGCSSRLKLYACAIMGNIDSSFISKYKSQIDAIYFDVAHDSNYGTRKRSDGIFFPAARQ